MNAVFHCPRCNQPLGTPDDPRPDPLPPCANCGWARVLPDNPRLSLGYLGTAGLFLLLGLGAGWVVGHSLLLVLVTFLAFGPMATVGIARMFSLGWFAFNLCYAAGLTVGMLTLNDGQTVSAGAWQFPVSVAVGSLLLGWLVGWLKHSE